MIPLAELEGVDPRVLALGLAWGCGGDDAPERSMVPKAAPTGTEAAGSGVDAQLFYLLNEMPVEPPGSIRLGGLDKRGAAALAAVSQKGELGNNEHLSLYSLRISAWLGPA